MAHFINQQKGTTVQNQKDTMDLSFSTEAEGLAYASSAGFWIHGNVATRPDMPETSFTLTSIGAGYCYVWVRD